MNNKTKPWPLYGYAPGGYTFTCQSCGKNALKDGSSFTDLVALADKRATMCLECAVIKAKEELEALRSSLSTARAEGKREGLEEAAKYHDEQAEYVMGQLHCGSENWEYRAAGKAADAHKAHAAAIRAKIEEVKP